MDLSSALDDSNDGGPWPGNTNNPTWPSNTNPAWPGGSSGQGMWPGGNPPPQPTAPGGWPSPAPAPGGWPSPAPGAGPAPGGWPSPAPGTGPIPGGWPSPAPASLSVPYQQNLPSGVYDKLLITIAGTIKPNANKITVDLFTPNDLAFHFNPRFNDEGKKVVVRNSRIGQKWGQEERHLQNFPFVQGQAFEIKILCTSTHFKVAVNNSHLLDYKHRITDLRSINKISITKDLILSKVEMETLP